MWSFPFLFASRPLVLAPGASGCEAPEEPREGEHLAVEEALLGRHGRLDANLRQRLQRLGEHDVVALDAGVQLAPEGVMSINS